MDIFIDMYFFICNVINGLFRNGDVKKCQNITLNVFYDKLWIFTGIFNNVLNITIRSLVRMFNENTCIVRNRIFSINPIIKSRFRNIKNRDNIRNRKVKKNTFIVNV